MIDHIALPFLSGLVLYRDVQIPTDSNCLLELILHQLQRTSARAGSCLPPLQATCPAYLQSSLLTFCEAHSPPPDFKAVQLQQYCSPGRCIFEPSELLIQHSTLT